jgi:large subunit ribosomal protein L15
MENELKPSSGAHRTRKRVGRGNGSGKGTYSTRGIKGQKSRSGGGVRPGFEGGQLPLIKRMPHLRGFTNIFKVEYTIVNIGRLAIFEPGTEVNPVLLAQTGIIKNTKRPIKILGQGDIDRPIKVAAHRFSQSAETKIQAVGGEVQRI